MTETDGKWEEFGDMVEGGGGGEGVLDDPHISVMGEQSSPQ